MNQKNLNYEIETLAAGCSPAWTMSTMNQKNLNYEIETLHHPTHSYRIHNYESKESQL